MYEVLATLVLPLLTAMVIYWIGGKVSAKGKATVDKMLAYACGEKLQGRKIQINFERFFIYAVYFMVFDVLAFIIATSMSFHGWLPMLYILIVAVSIIPLTHGR